MSTIATPVIIPAALGPINPSQHVVEAKVRRNAVALILTELTPFTSIHWTGFCDSKQFSIMS
jgi:hypothetical protein